MDSTATEYTSAAGAADETKYPSIMETSTSPEVPDSTFSSQSSSRESPISQQSRGLDEINPLLKDSHPSLLRHNTDLGPEGGSGRRYSVCAVCLGGSGSEYDFEPCYCTNSDSSVPIDSTSSTDHLPEAVHTESRHSQSNEISTTGLGQLLKAVNMASKDPALEHVQSLSWMSFEGDEASRTPSRFLNFLNSASQNPGSEIKRNEVKQRLLDQKNRSGMSMATGLGKSEAEDLPSTQQLPIGRDDEDDSNATEDDDQAQQLEEQSAKKAARTPVKYDEETMDTTPIKSTQARKRKRSLTPDLSPEEPTWYYLHKLPESHIATIDSIFDELLKEFPTFSKQLAHVRRKVDATFDFVQWTNYDLALTTSTFKNIFKWRNSLWFHCKGEVAINELARLYFDIQNEMNAPPLASDAPSYPNIHNFPDSVLHTLDSILDRFVEEFPQFSNRRASLEGAIGAEFDLVRLTKHSLKSVDSIFRELFEAEGIPSDGKVAIKELAVSYFETQNAIKADDIDEGHNATANGNQPSNPREEGEGSSGGPIGIGENSLPTTKVVDRSTEEMNSIAQKDNSKKRRTNDEVGKMQSDLGPLWQTPLEDRKAKRTKVHYEE